MPLTHIADLPGFRLDPPTVEEPCLIIVAHSTCTEVHCPTCVQPTTRTHGQYIRRIDDVPWGSRRACLRLLLHRFRCVNMACPRQTFVEPLPTIAPPYARRTRRLADHQQHLALALGGEAGARLADRLSLGTSPDTLLRLIRAFAPVFPVAPKRVGIDDWAFRKGCTYGTIVLDLETHRPIDLLADRTTETVAAWLEAHPSVTHVSRDRATAYANAVYQGAPNAVQIADRWHLLKNLGDALLTIIEQHYRSLQRATTADVAAGAQDAGGHAAIPTKWQYVSKYAREQTQHQHAERDQRDATIRQLRERGWQQRAIAAHVGVTPKTVRRVLTKPIDLEPQRRSRGSQLDPFLPYLVMRWEAGCTTAARLFREVHQQGFSGTITTVRTFIQALRKRDQHSSMHRPARPAAPRVELPARRTIVSWILRDQATLRPEQVTLVAWMADQVPLVNEAIALSQQFTTLVRTRTVADFDGWLEAMEGSELAPFRRLAKSFRQDEAAIRAGLSLRWSQGPVEGTIHRLKLLKRQMYGQAKLDLLRQRLLARL